MNVENVMTRAPRTCRRTDSLATAAKILWDHDCGVVPVVDDGQRPVGMLTDRDCLMSAFTRGRRLDELSVQSAMAHMVFSVTKDQPVATALERMREHQVRRLPVVDGDGRICGIVALADLLRAGGPTLTEGQLARAAAAIMTPRAASKGDAVPAAKTVSAAATPRVEPPAKPVAVPASAKPVEVPAPTKPVAAAAKPAPKKGKRS